MYNSFQYNTNQYNNSFNLFNVNAQDNIVFNGYSLQSTSIKVTQLLQDNTPERDLQVNAIPRGDGEFIIGDYWRRKTLYMKGYIVKDTNAELEQEIDNMKKALAVREANLDIKIAGVIRRYKATLISGQTMFNNREHFHVTFIPFEITFLCVEPYGHSVDYEATTLLGQTTLVLNEQVNNNGTIRAKPIVIMLFNSASGVIAISFKNNTRNEEIIINENINTNDIVLIDGENLQVTINNVVVDYSGSFPLLDTGPNSYTITITGTSANYDLTVKHLTPYL